MNNQDNFLEALRILYLEAIKNLMFYIEGDEKHLSALRMIYADEVTEKERHLIAKFCNENNVDLDRLIR